ncbi:hypothetical protein AGMMS50293_31060 [Spirochaetia bacterium]|nr:hypothetical protein AGMMS50293_31060 [Spirochaetia bacterium]
MGGLTLNIANFGSILDFVGSAIGRNNGGGQSGLGKVIEAAENTGFLELHIGSGRASMELGTGGINVGGTLYDLAKRGIDYAALQRYSRQNEEAGKIALQAYGWGDWTAENTAARLASGVDKLVLGGVRYDERGNIVLGETTRNEQGNGRIITLADIGKVNDMAIRLQHEAYRDGLVSNDNYIETQQAVLAHTKMAKDMLNGGQTIGTMNLRDIDAYNKADGDMSKFYAYVDENYGSSADFWKIIVKDDGTYKMEVEYDENGNVIDDISVYNEHNLNDRLAFFAYQGGSRTGFIAETLGLGKNEVNTVMGSWAGWTYENGSWTNGGTTDGVVRFGTDLSQKMSFPLSVDQRNTFQTILGTSYIGANGNVQPIDYDNVRVRYVFTDQTKQDLQNASASLVSTLPSAIQQVVPQRINDFITAGRALSLAPGVSAGTSAGIIYLPEVEALNKNTQVHEFYHQVEYQQDSTNFTWSIWEQLIYDNGNGPDVYDYGILGTGSRGQLNILSDLMGQRWGLSGMAQNRGIEAQAQFFGEFAGNYYGSPSIYDYNYYLINKMADILYQSGYYSKAIDEKRNKP